MLNTLAPRIAVLNRIIRMRISVGVKNTLERAVLRIRRSTVYGLVAMVSLHFQKCDLTHLQGTVRAGQYIL
jgi:hypothetical protein